MSGYERPLFNATTIDAPRTPDRTKRRAARELVIYIGLTFALTWGISVALLVFPVRQLKSWLILLAVWAPTLSAVIVSLTFGGLSGLRALAVRALRPASVVWIAIAIFGLPAAILVLGLGERIFAPGSQHFIDLRALVFGAPTVLFASFTSLGVVTSGGLGEEPGWRGFALPRLIHLMAPLPAAITLGVIWGVWHLPVFLAPGGLSQSNFGLFLVSTAAMTVFMTWIYVHANGNFLIAGVVPHLVANSIGDAHVLARDLDKIEVVVFGALAAIVVLAYGPSLQGWRRMRAVPS